MAEDITKWVGAFVALFTIVKMWIEISGRARIQNLKAQLESAKLVVEIRSDLGVLEEERDRLAAWVTALEKEGRPAPPTSSGPLFKKKSDEPTELLRKLDLAANAALAPPVIVTGLFLAFFMLAAGHEVFGFAYSRGVQLLVLGAPLWVPLVLTGIYKVAKTIHGASQPVAADARHEGNDS